MGKNPGALRQQAYKTPVLLSKLRCDAEGRYVFLECPQPDEMFSCPSQSAPVGVCEKVSILLMQHILRGLTAAPQVLVQSERKYLARSREHVCGHVEHQPSLR
jgi:hypothetical protein